MAPSSLSSRSKHSRQPDGAGTALAGRSVLLSRRPWRVGPGLLHLPALWSPMAGLFEQPGVLTPPSRQGAALGHICVCYCRCRSQGFAAPMRFSQSQGVQCTQFHLIWLRVLLFEREMRGLERNLRPQGDLAGLWQSWGLVSGVLSPFLAHFPSTCWVSSHCWDTVTFSVTQPSKHGVYVLVTHRRPSWEFAVPSSAEAWSDGESCLKSWGDKCWGSPRRMWLPAPGTGGPVSPALGTAAFCCPLVRFGSRVPFGVPTAPTPPFGVPRAGAQPLGSPGQDASLQYGGTLW